MRLLIFLSVFCLVCYYVNCKNSNVKSLTESMGQEVIEIGAPIKGLNELPPDIDEEPSAEEDDDDVTTTPTTTTIAPATKKGSVATEARRRGSKEIDKIVDREDEDARIEKELAEIYKDNLDYKADITETTSISTTTAAKTPTTTKKEIVFITANVVDTDTDVVEEKPIVRSKTKESGQQKLMLTTESSTNEKQNSSNSSRITMNILLLLASYYTLSTYG